MDSASDSLDARIVVGFDCRVVPPVRSTLVTRHDRLNSHESMHEYVGLQLSVDPEVWPRVELGFTAGAPQHAHQWFQNGLGFLLEPLPRDVCDIVVTESAVPAFQQIAVDIAHADIAYLGQMFGQMQSKTMPKPQNLAEANWLFGGYDVVDVRTLVSAIAGFEYSRAEEIEIYELFGAQLNFHGLFTDLAPAKSYSWRSDTNMPEHAPFSVMGIWLAA